MGRADTGDPRTASGRGVCQVVREHRHGARPGATQIPLAGERLTELQREPGFVLIREAGRSPIDVTDLHQAQRADAGPAVLVRPDGYIAWAGDSADRSEWLVALACWTDRGLVKALG
jgi:hypothetical protein